MTITLDALTHDVPEDVHLFLQDHPLAMLYHQPAWLRLVATMTASTLYYLVAREASTGVVTGVIPLCVKKGSLGNVANSSPFFGSHGGILARDERNFVDMAQGLQRFLHEQNVMLANLVEPLFETSSTQYQRAFAVSASDHRVGQFKDLRTLTDREALLASVRGLTRSNLTRKSWRCDLKISRDDSAAGLDTIYAMHVEEMGAKVGGNPKPKRFFDLIGRHYEASTYRIYLGTIDEEIVAGLLLLVWRNWVEYITPVFSERARKHQPLSALIFQAMLEAAQDGFHWWNFGGTWLTQDGLRSFKDSWGVQNKDYHYHILDLGGLDAVKRADQNQIVKEYYGFYLYPF